MLHSTAATPAAVATFDAAADETQRTIALQVKARRTAAGLSRKALALKAGVSERYLTALEKGEANVSIGILHRVATALEARLIEFVAPDELGAQSGTLDPAFAKAASDMTASEQAAVARQLPALLAEIRRAQRGIALLGLRGAGKSTIGRAYAGRHGLPFVSITREIEARAGMSIDDLFSLGGDEAYRALETDVAADLAKRPGPVVVETAGGIVSNPAALDIVLGAFRAVWLKASPEDHLQRVASQGDARPVSGHPKALEHLKSILDRRAGAYAKAELTLDTSARTVEACVDALSEMAGALTTPAS